MAPKRTPRRLGAVLVTLTPEEREEIRDVARRTGEGVIPWIRRIALAAARRESMSEPDRRRAEAQRAASGPTHAEMVWRQAQTRGRR